MNDLFIPLSDVQDGYNYSLEAFDDRNNSCGGCRTKSKDDLRKMYNLWKERYPSTMNLRYVFKKDDKQIAI